MLRVDGRLVADGELVWLSCDQASKFKGHAWTTQADKNAQYEVVQPQCPRCGQIYSRVQVLQVTINEDVACTAKCWDAEGPKCNCSCGGRNHARGKPLEDEEAAADDEGDSCIA